MPPKRKSGTQSEAPSSQQKKRKSTDNATPDEPEASASPPKDTPNPHDYVVIQRTMADVVNENKEKDEEDQLDEDELDKKFEGLTNVENVLKPASDFPNETWIAMSAAWKTSLDYHRRVTYTCPDLFDMHIYNDFCSYGVIECIENLLLELDIEFRKKEGKRSVEQMWALSAALVHWMPNEDVGPWMACEHGERVTATCGLIGCAFLSTLNELDMASLLKADSPIKDLGLVISLYVTWSHDLDGYGCDEPKHTKWRGEMLAYVKKAGIDIEASGVFGVRDAVEKLVETYKTISSLKGAAKADRWGWKKTLTSHGKKYGKGGKIGGEQYNILKMTKAERTKYNFDNKDPLADFSAKDLREGKIMLT